MVEPPKAGASGEPPRELVERVRERIAPFKLWQVVVAPLIVALVSGITIALVTGGGDEPPVVVRNGVTQQVAPPPEEPPKNVIEAIERRDFWTAPPTTFKSADATPTGFFGPLVEVDHNFNPETVTPEELATQAADYEGQTLILVGRVLEVLALTSQFEFELEDEVRLAGRNGTTAFIGTGFAFADRGEVVFAVGRVAATGQARTPGGHARRAAYFLAAPEEDVENAAEFFSDLNPAIARAARQAERTPLTD